jgi:HNH endonuclease
MADIDMVHTTAQKGTSDPSLALAGLASRYPEKTFFLGQVFKDTTSSYKLVWFLAILALIKRSEQNAFLLADIFTEMAVAAWHPVCLYRLSLGRQDRLQHVVHELQEKSGLAPHATPEAIREFVTGSGAIRRLGYFGRYVPTRFLAPWVANHLRGVPEDWLRTRKTIEFARDSQTTAFACPYFFDVDTIRLNDSRRVFLRENLGVVESFAEHHFAMYLQTRNPNVPGVLSKLHAPTLRQLTAARNFWRLVRSGFERAEKLADFRDIYSERQLTDNFSVDHFLPWTFVVHDLLWNLTPVEDATNSKKGDVLPDLDVYLPRLAKLHFNATQAAKHQPRLLVHCNSDI